MQFRSCCCVFQVPSQMALYYSLYRSLLLTRALWGANRDTGIKVPFGMHPEWCHLMFSLLLSPQGLLPPRSLTFSEVASRSFRATWETDAFNVLSYLIQFRPAADTNGDFVSMSVPGDTLTALLPHLTPVTLYEVNVFAQYAQGDSFPLNGFETTLDGQYHQTNRYQQIKNLMPMP